VDLAQPRTSAFAPDGSQDHARARTAAHLELLDAPPQESFDRLTRLAARLLGAHAALVALIDSDRQFILSQVGLAEPWASARRTPHSHSFCRAVADGERPLTVSDDGVAEPDARGASAEFGARAYVGVPVFLAGECIGALCALDGAPREWTQEDVLCLQEIAAMLATEFELRGARLERDTARAALSDSEEHVRLAFDAAAIGIVTISLEPGSAGTLLGVNEAFCEFLGRPGESLLGTSIDELTHPADRAASREVIGGLAAGERSLVRHLEKRYLHADGHVVWGALTTATAAASDGGQAYVIALLEDVTERRQADQDLPAIANVLRRILSGEDAREAIVQAAVDIAGASSSYLLERDGADHLLVTASVGLNLRGVQVPLGEPSATAHTYLSGEPMFMADPAESPLVSPELLELSGGRSIMWQPIFRHDEVLGVLCVCWAERVSDISTRAARAVALLTDETAVALAHHEALQRLAAQATTDGLTGLPNRRAWEERLTRDIASARRLQRPVTLALLDMDRFKHYNDTHGHAAGDDLLCEFAASARVLLREGDTLARWGGEEFAVLLPDCPSANFAESILDRIRAAVPAGQSCSVGYASWDGLESAEDLVARADRALYRAKAMGRDRAASAEPAQGIAARRRPRRPAARPRPT
jgi:diguanylate cyclase (GGDEF)-like protein/PAS domain S-box-containing protein